jgi:hypothetical protein
MKSAYLKLLSVTGLAGLWLMVSFLPAQAATLHGRNFVTPSGNIQCHLQSDNVLRCDIHSGLNPQPNKPCDLDWVGLLLGRMDRAQPNCAGDAIAASSPPVLHYGQKWERRGRICTAKETGLYCMNYSGYHFKLARDHWRRWYRP